MNQLSRISVAVCNNFATARRRADGALAFAHRRGHEIHTLADRAPPVLAATG